MTTELEQKFYDTFGIEKVKDFNYCNGGIVEYYLKYPEITDHKLLEMICILNETSYEILEAENIEDLKNEILETCIKVYNTPIITSDGDEYENTTIYDKIQQLFKD